MVGDRFILSTSRQTQERRLQNVVEEMATASGIACPRIYVLEREGAINAFVTGFNQNEAVIAVTRGALERLSRDELQGVVGHEFSHILNGDMRLVPVRFDSLTALAGECGLLLSLVASVADLLSTICTAIDAPMPPVVLATYSGFAWGK
ncbi:MAG: M48 family metalloprotease [Herminiimonas sp.]|nr:M48 family metalloprotease [Herminiimonas sp.]